MAYGTLNMLDKTHAEYRKYYFVAGDNKKIHIFTHFIINFKLLK